MPDDLAFLFEVTDRLESAGIAYMVTGSYAMAFYGRPRMTRDLDIVIQIDPAHVTRMIEPFQHDFYLDAAVIRDAVLRRGMFNLIDQRSIMKVDFVVRKNEPYRIEEFQRRRRLAHAEKSAWVVAPEDLILSKLLWVKETESELQLRDVRDLLQMTELLDDTYLGEQAIRLGVADLLRKAKHDA